MFVLLEIQTTEQIIKPNSYKKKMQTNFYYVLFVMVHTVPIMCTLNI